MEGVDFVYGSCEDFCVDIKVFVDIGENFVKYRSFYSFCGWDLCFLLLCFYLVGVGNMGGVLL